MKSFITLFLLTFSVIVTAQNEPVKVADGNQIEIKTSAICDMCKHAIEYDLAFEKGVKTALLNLDDKVVTIVYNPKKTSAETLRKRITKVGYHADQLQRDPAAYEKLPLCCKDGAHDESNQKDPK